MCCVGLCCWVALGCVDVAYVLFFFFNFFFEEPPLLHLSTPAVNTSTLQHLNTFYTAGKEPPFTNYAFTVRDEQAFVDTLDYFFMSPGVAAVEVGDLPESTDAIPGTSLPSAEEPSDHLLVSAVFEINGDNDSSKL